MSKKTEKQKTALVLRSCNADMSSRNGFVWPDVGEVAECPDWKPIAECGNGLHGWLYGQGDHDCSNYLSADSKWLVVEVVLADVVMLGGKCKFPRGAVKFIGTMTEAAAYLREHEPLAREVAVIGATINVGEKQSAIAGALATLTGADGCTLTGTDYCTLTGGYRCTLTGADYCTFTAGDNSEIRASYWDKKSERRRTVIGYVGEDGLQPGVAYQLDENHKFIAVKEDVK